jgi:hypothetical protein
VLSKRSLALERLSGNGWNVSSGGKHDDKYSVQFRCEHRMRPRYCRDVHNGNDSYCGEDLRTTAGGQGNLFPTLLDRYAFRFVTGSNLALFLDPLRLVFRMGNKLGKCPW